MSRRRALKTFRLENVIFITFDGRRNSHARKRNRDLELIRAVSSDLQLAARARDAVMQNAAWLLLGDLARRSGNEG